MWLGFDIPDGNLFRRSAAPPNWVKCIEFKPGRSTGPTENDRSSRSSDDLSKEEEMWPTRKVAVALGAALRTKEGQPTGKTEMRCLQEARIQQGM